MSAGKLDHIPSFSAFAYPSRARRLRPSSTFQPSLYILTLLDSMTTQL